MDKRDRTLEARRKTLLLTLPLMAAVLAMLPGVIHGKPGLLPFEAQATYLSAVLIAGAFIHLLRNKSHVLEVSNLTACVTLAITLYRSISVILGPGLLAPGSPIFLPVFAYLPFSILAFYVLMRPAYALSASLLVWATAAGLTCYRLVPAWDQVAHSYGGKALLIYVVAALPMFIFAMRLVEYLSTELRDTSHRVSELEFRNQMNRAILERERRFQLAVKGSRDGLWEWPDLSRPGLWCSARTLEMLGIDHRSEQSSVRRLYRRIHPEHRRTFRTMLRQALTGDREIDLELRVDAGTGHFRWFAVRGVVRMDREGNPVKMAGSLQDIDRRKTAEDRLRRSHEAFRHFAHSAGHDIAAPLNRIGLLVGLVERRHPELAEDEKAAGSIDKIHAEIDYLQDLMDAMLRFAELRADAQLDDTDCTQIAHEVIETFAEQARERRACIEIEAPLPRAYCNSAALRSILQNLVSNALKFGGSETLVKISGTRTGSRVAISVRDNGPGIPAEDLERITDAFARVDATRNTPGHGLGLATVKRLLESMGGNLQVESELGRGSTFTTHLDAARSSTGGD